MDKNFQYILATAACVLVLYYIMSPLQQCKRQADAKGYSHGPCYVNTSW
jgi:hypothetical protein